MENNGIRVIRVSDVEPFSPRDTQDIFYSRMLIDNQSAGSEHLVVNEFTLKCGKSSYKGSHPMPYDEVYYVLKGKGFLVLEDDEERKYEIEPGIIAFIPCGVQHHLINSDDEDMVLLTIMHKIPVKGVNSLYDSRIEEWNTSFRMKENAKGVKYSVITPDKQL